MKKKSPKRSQQTDKRVILVSHIDDIYLVDTILIDGIPQFVVSERDGGAICYEESFSINGTEFHPLERTSSFLASRALLLPTGIEGYKSLKDLLGEIKTYLYKYVDTSEQFMKIVPYYVLLTYLFDNFPEIPYLRVIGDYGSGKSRFMRVVGGVCYSSIITNGGASVASLFRIIEKIKGTLVLDEADFPFSDTTNDIIKILNNGFQKGNPIMRVEGESFEPRAFDVYCPKIIGGRMEFKDKATESRCISEIMKRSTRQDIPLNLGKEFMHESESLRNKLYKFRHDYFDKIPLINERVPELEGRLNQILNPILSIIKFIGNTDDYSSIIEYFLSRQKEIRRERQHSIEGMIFAIVRERKERGMSFVLYQFIISEIRRQDSTSTLNGRKLGCIFKQFNIRTLRRGEGFGLDIDENRYVLEQLYKTFGINEGMDT